MKDALMPIAMIAIVVIAIVSVLSFVVENMTDAPAVRVTVEQPVDTFGKKTTDFSNLPPTN